MLKPSPLIHLDAILNLFLFLLYFNTKQQQQKIQTSYNSTNIIAVNSEYQEIFSRSSHDKMMQNYITVSGKTP